MSYGCITQFVTPGRRRMEARIGQLLEKVKGGRGKTRPHTDEISRNEDRSDFRLLAQRRMEARIGQLLGEAKRGGKAAEQLDSRMSESVSRPDDRSDFRLLAQRRMEARIGQLLGEPKRGRPERGKATHAEDIGRDADRSDFRLLAQRRMEARIGQLLGEAKKGSHHSVTTEGARVFKDDRQDFRKPGRRRGGLP